MSRKLMFRLVVIALAVVALVGAASRHSRRS